ncbi:MAG: TIGR00701 family protein [Lysobacterales bacterium 69-70]|nr:MAG: TIGR00701 family protein [Xanthomonadaceae bacterium SCN 69-320]ODV15506.1 MAG: TIGR00701 family protein [Xanthomonadaceae bacterium SCN 69-25]OJY98537.1 MAG: TIGR00701 family protein [Xanthomonadales bacterium 69-70]
MLWLKAFHVIAVVTWFAGLFYLPRLFIYHTEASESVVRERFKIMERRLLVMTNIGATLTLIFGVAALAWWVMHVPGYFKANTWLHAKLLLVVLLYAYHGYLARLTREFAADRCTHSSRWLRIFNEVPALLLIGIVILVVVQPFKG